MMRRIVAAVCLLGLFLLPRGRGTDIGDLKPVEVLLITIEEGRICVETDTGDRGIGITLKSALEDMKETSDGEIFLETVSYVLVTEDTSFLLEELGRILRPGTEAVLAAGSIAPEDVVQFLKVHEPGCDLRRYLTGQKQLPKLMTAGERCYLVQPEIK